MGQQLVDAPLALSRHRPQKLLMVLGRQMAGNKAGGGRAQGPALEQAGDRRVLPHGPCHFDPVVDGILGKTQHAHAVLEERRVPGALEEPPGVELRQMDDEGRRR